jgi:hypothetical protein
METVRVYKFYSQQWGLEAIKNKRLKVSTLDDLNDPFEFLAPSLRNPCNREALKRVKRNMNDWFGIISFSRKWQNPVLWSHYADSHKGIALGFDITGDNILSEIKYCLKRLPFPNDKELDMKWSWKIGQSVKVYSKVMKEYQNDEETEVFGSV